MSNAYHDTMHNPEKMGQHQGVRIDQMRWAAEWFHA